ncbi:MAG: InlB B-repeat-containing protein [Clostridiales Family XIII bacterium]|jgi:uncharacterized repeat protein (TIGR02543 family)/uncharacterized repeat protein (TIGR01451 family)|nr:InlB B-repeat-containing protein [Clostridiales Family XIII bacterium]
MYTKTKLKFKKRVIPALSILLIAALVIPQTALATEAGVPGGEAAENVVNATVDEADIVIGEAAGAEAQGSDGDVIGEAAGAGMGNTGLGLSTLSTSFTVISTDELIAAIGDTDSTIDITIGADFEIDKQINIPANKTVTIDGGGHTLTRAYEGVIFSETGAGSSLTLKDLVLDGDAVTVEYPAILLDNAASSLHITGDSVIKNFKSSQRDKFVIHAGNGSLVIDGSTRIIDNSVDRSVLRTAGNADATICGDVEFSGNKITGTNGGVIMAYGNSTLTVKDRVKIHDTESNGFGGAFCINNNAGHAKVTITDYVEIYKNKVKGDGGGLYLYSTPGPSGNQLTISGHVKIYDNEAGDYGGGISADSGTLRISGNVEIYGNKSTGSVSLSGYLIGGGGVSLGVYEPKGSGYVLDAAISGDVRIHDNKASTGGGGIVIGTYGGLSAANPVQIGGSVQIYDNEAEGHGGGILNLSPVNIDGTVSITGNTAGLDGGGIFTADYSKLKVGADVTFADNTARASYEIKPFDIPLHDANVLTHTFTAPFEYGYNNYDINYYRSDAKTSSAAGTAGTGDIITYTVTVKNSSTAAGDIIIKDKAPVGTSGFADTTPAAGNLTVTAEGDLTVWTFANVAAGDDAAVTFTVKVTAEIGEISNTAIIREPADVDFRNTPTTADKLANPYTIIYNPNTGAGAMANTDVVYGENAELRANAFSKAGYTFTGWNTRENGTGSPYADGYAFAPYDIAGNLTLYAQWKAIAYTVTYAPGAHGTFAAQVTSGLHYGNTTPAAPQTLSEAGWRFTGWTPSPAKAVVGTAVYTAQWAQSSYTVYYHGNGNTEGTTPGAVTLPHGSAWTAAAQGDLARDGFTFLGWSADSEAAAAALNPGDVNTLTGDVHLYAVWQVVTPPPVEPPPAVTPRTPVNPPRTPVNPPVTSVTPPSDDPGEDEEDRAAAETTPAPPVQAPSGDVEAGTSPQPESEPQAERLAAEGFAPRDVARIEAQTGNPLTDLLGGNVPLGNGKSAAVRSLLSLILSIIAVVITVLLAVGALLRGRNKDEESEARAGERGEKEKGRRRGRLLKLLAGIVGILTLIVWLILDDTSLPMAWINRYTLIVAVFFLVHLVLFAAYKVRGGRKNKFSETIEIKQ